MTKKIFAPHSSPRFLTLTRHFLQDEVKAGNIVLFPILSHCQNLHFWSLIVLYKSGRQLDVIIWHVQWKTQTLQKKEWDKITTEYV